MPYVIYADVLLLVNFYLTSVLLILTGAVLDLKLHKLRIFLASLTGAAYSFVIFLPRLPGWLSFLMSGCLAAILMEIAFRPRSFYRGLRAWGCFFLLNFSLAGVLQAASMFLDPSMFAVRNMVGYIGISPMMLLSVTLLFYLAARLILYLVPHGNPRRVLVRVDGRERTQELTGLVDTGNLLRDPLTGLPVVFTDLNTFAGFAEDACRRAVERYLTDGVLSENDSPRFRVIPYTTMTGSGLLPVVRPEKAEVLLHKNWEQTDFVLGITEKRQIPPEYDLLLPPAIG